MPTQDPFDNLRKLIQVYQNSLKPINDAIEVIRKRFEPFLLMSAQLQENLTKIAEQIKKNFVEAINALETPEKYNSTIKLHEGIHTMASNFSGYLDEIHKSPLSYLQDRLEIGLDAHFRQDYHLSIYCIFSVIDGILTWFYCQKNDCTNYPSFNKKLQNFLDVYKFEDIIGKEELKTKFDIFIKHRNQIMHGGEFAHFDRNLSTIALLFLGIVYNSVREDIQKTK